MPRPKKLEPYNPAKVHDRVAKDLGKDALIYSVEIDDPFEPGAKIFAARSRRDDPLANLDARGQIDEAQYMAGREFQRDFETAERGPKAVDLTREAVDGGLMPEPITEAQKRAAKRLAGVYKELGPDGSALIHDVLISRLTHKDIAEKRGLSGRRWEEYFGMRFCECLHRLSYFYGFAVEPTGKKRIVSQ